MKKIGLIARGEDRGLGILSWEFARHVRPDRVLLVDMGDLARGFDMHDERYSLPLVASFDGHLLDENIVRSWLDGLDVVYSAETFYDPRVVGWARAAGVKTVLHVMPEFYRADLDQPDEVWLPTSWRAEHVPHARLVPVPVALDRWPLLSLWQRREDHRLRVLHVAGRRAANDRNGTNVVLAALRLMHRNVDVTITCQDNVRSYARRGLEWRVGNEPDYWKLYRGFDVLLMPRRFGGLCLPAQEAMGAGLGLVMTKCLPNIDWPIVPIEARTSGKMRTPGGQLELVNATPVEVAKAVNVLARDEDALVDAQSAARHFAVAHSWEHWTDRYREMLCD